MPEVGLDVEAEVGIDGEVVLPLPLGAEAAMARLLARVSARAARNNLLSQRAVQEQLLVHIAALSQ